MVWKLTPGIVVGAAYPGTVWTTGAGAELHRRSLYTFWKRTVPHPAMIAFDALDRIPRLAWADYLDWYADDAATAVGLAYVEGTTQGRVLFDGKPVGSAVADAYGRWSLKPKDPLAPGLYTLRVDLLGEDGRVAHEATGAERRHAGRCQRGEGHHRAERRADRVRGDGAEVVRGRR